MEQAGELWPACLITFTDPRTLAWYKVVKEDWLKEQRENIPTIIKRWTLELSMRRMSDLTNYRETRMDSSVIPLNTYSH